MNCFSCKSTQCCPEHCCDWDSCRCGDCENCGGPKNSKKETQSISGSQSTVDESEDIRHLPKPQPPPKKEEEMSIHEIIQIRVQEKLKEQREREAEVNREYEEKRSVEKARHEEILASSRATIAKNKEVLESTQVTLDRLQSVISGIKETEQKFKDFQDSFGKIMSESLERCLGGSSENVEEMQAKHGKPKETSIEEVAQVLLNAESVCVLTGAGVSAESGVYTYKDSEETWDVDGKAMTMQEVMNIDILQGYPLEFWQNIQYNRVRMSTCSPNGVHYALADLINFFRTRGKSACIVTQNIDGFDGQVLGNDNDLYEIHGNTHNMRCLFDCCDEVFPGPDLSDMIYSIPLCPCCGAIARPNVLLYGEEYTEKWYRAETAVEAVKNSQVLVVIGTQIKCGLPNERVKEFAKDGKVIIEINVEPVIEYGNVLVLPRTCGEVVPPIVEVMRNMG